MDDSKLVKGSIKVRCSKCKQVFLVTREESPVEDDTLANVKDSAGAEQGFPSETVDQAAPGEFSFTKDDEQTAFPQGDESGKFPGNSAESGFDMDDFGAASPESQRISNQIPGSDGVNDQIDFEISGFGEEQSLRNTQTTIPDNDADGMDFHFGETAPLTTTPSAAADIPVGRADHFDAGFDKYSSPPGEASTSTKKIAGGGEEFEFGLEADSPAPAATGNAEDRFEISFANDFAETGAVKSRPLEGKGAESTGGIDFGEFDFGSSVDDHALPVKKEEATKKQPEPSAPSLVEDEHFSLDEKEELPPLSIPSRRKSSSFFPAIVLGAILVVIALVCSGVYFLSGPQAFNKIGLGFLVNWSGQKASDEGSISLKNITAEYVKNAEGVELFVVRGEAVNEFKKSRASIQVKVSVIGTGGAVLLSKTAYCGNPLSKEQIASLPLVKFDEAMNNQFGDSLANLGTKPGVAIPFVVILSNVPKEAVDYTVQVEGSTVASQ
jgi:hypothetical protein